ncbi:MAG: pyridoxal phosphate-dependent aminotransferase, partial [Candidatus Omnitrophota bacterium]|nr:pyridoxal phosphate-dependent aminotransferase [Candidatus Omnitrophota bacterium]
KEMAKQGIDVVSLAAGEPDFDTPEHVKAAAIKAIEAGFTKYTPSSGMPELREAIAREFKKDKGVDYEPSQIVVSNGAKHSLYNIFQALVDEGEEVLIPSPYWLSYPAMVGMAGGKSVFVQTEPASNFKITGKDLRSKITNRTRCLILNSPSNPTGAVYTRDELKMIADIALEHKFFVISDEIYGKLVYDNVECPSIASLGDGIRDRTITVDGVSKSYSMTGWRIGYAAGPLGVMKAISNLQSHATSNPCSISQKAALEALSGNQECVEKMRKEFEKRRDIMVSRINSMKKIICIKPAGAFYVFCDISKLRIGSVKLANRLLEEAGVAVIPGEPFGADSFIRLSFATSTEKITKGLDRIEEWLNKLN